MDTNTTRNALSDESLGRLFLEARSQNGFSSEAVDDALLHRLHALMRMGPTSMNCQPGRFIFVRTVAAKERLAACVSPNNKAKVLSAPVVAIIGMDTGFVDLMPRVFPHMDVRPFFEGKGRLIEETAFRNSSLQGAYLMLAARALGLDCGPMSGFDAQAVDALLWADSTVRTNFICTLGYGDPAKVMPRLPRLNFEEACRLL